MHNFQIFSKKISKFERSKWMKEENMNESRKHDSQKKRFTKDRTMIKRFSR